MTCPNCGGGERVAITPNFFECRSPVVAGAVPGHPAAHAGPTHPVFRVCGTRYHVATPNQGVPSCGCGLYSIGACVQCLKPACGFHGGLIETGEFLCTEDTLARRERRKAEEREHVRRDEEAEADRQRGLGYDWRALPEMTHDQVANFLASDEPLDFSDNRRPVFRGARLPEISRTDFVRIVERGEFPQRHLRTGKNSFFLGPRTTKVWVVGTRTWTSYIRSDPVETGGYIGVHESRLINIEWASPSRETKVRLILSGPNTGWEPTARKLETARRLLRGESLLPGER